MPHSSPQPEMAQAGGSNYCSLHHRFGKLEEYRLLFVFPQPGFNEKLGGFDASVSIRSSFQG
jgi:hypothetical protein